MNVNFSSYIFSELSSKIFETPKGDTPSFDEATIDYIENMVFQVSSLKKNLNIEVRDLIENEAITSFASSEVKLLISMLCISHCLDKGIAGDQTADERLQKYLVKIWGHQYFDLFESHSVASNLLKDAQYKLSVLCQSHSDEEDEVITFRDLG